MARETLLDLQNRLNKDEPYVLHLGNFDYQVIEVLSEAGGSCLVYIAERLPNESEFHNISRRKSVIKEFYPKSLSVLIKRKDDGSLDYSDCEKKFIEKKEQFFRGCTELSQFYKSDSNHALNGSLYVCKNANSTAYSVFDVTCGTVLCDIDRHNLTLYQAAQIMISLCNAVDKIHQNKKLYLDIKPDNVFLFDYENSESRRIALFDFDSVEDIENLRDVGNATPAWTNKAQRKWDKFLVSEGCDLFSIGMLFYWLLTGEADSRHINSVAKQNFQDLEKHISINIGKNNEQSKSIQISKDLLKSFFSDDSGAKHLNDVINQFKYIEDSSASSNDRPFVADKIQELLDLFRKDSDNNKADKLSHAHYIIENNGIVNINESTKSPNEVINSGNENESQDNGIYARKKQKSKREFPYLIPAAIVVVVICVVLLREIPLNKNEQINDSSSFKQDSENPAVVANAEYNTSIITESTSVTQNEVQVTTEDNSESRIMPIDDISPKPPIPDTSLKTDFVPTLISTQEILFPLFTDKYVKEKGILSVEYNTASMLCTQALYNNDNDLPIIADDNVLNSSPTYYNDVNEANDLYKELKVKYENGGDLSEIIDEMNEIISIQETAYDYSKNELGGIGQTLIILTARNYFELGCFYSQNNDNHLAYTSFMKAIEKYALCYNILKNDSYWQKESDIQNEYQIDYWIANVFTYIGDLDDLDESYRISCFISSCSFYDRFCQSNPNSAIEKYHAYSKYFSGIASFKIAYLSRKDNPDFAQKFAHSAILYYSEYLDQDANVTREDYKRDCTASIENLNLILNELERDSV
jgi:serine/threonine protein kinase